MTFDLPPILASKRAFRHDLASASILGKLAMLDELHGSPRRLKLPFQNFPLNPAVIWHI